MSQFAVVVLDHHTARILHLAGSDEASLVLHESPERETDDREAMSGKSIDHAMFFDNVAKALRDVKEILIVGGGTAKEQFKHRLDDKFPQIAANVVGVEAVNNPSDGELLAMAKTRFKNINAWLGMQR